MYEHWDTFILMLAERGFTDQDIGLIVGGISCGPYFFPLVSFQ